MRASKRGPWSARIAVAALLGVGALVLFRFIGVLRADWATSIATMVVLVAAVTVLAASISDHGARLHRAYWDDQPLDESAPPTSLDPQMTRLTRDLRDAVEREDRPDTIHAQIRDLARERLLRRHQIDLDAEPELAAQVVPADLRRYLDSAPRDTGRVPSHEIARALSRIEDL